METEIIYALGLLMEQVSDTSFTLLSEPVKMVLEECIKAAAAINMDNTHPYLLTCTPFVETVLAQ